MSLNDKGVMMHHWMARRTDESDGTLSRSPPASIHQEDETGMTTDSTPLHIPQNIPIPDDVELRESRTVPAVGIWSRSHIPVGQKFGPFLGILKTDIEDTSCAWELVDEFGKVKGWIDASDLGTGNWMKYVRSAEDREHQNLMAIQLEDQVYYKTIRDIAPGKEMLLFARDAVYPENELEAIARQKMEDEEKSYVCPQCNELFRSKVALRRHQTYACNNRGSIFKAINQDFHDDGSYSMDLELPSEIESGDSGEFKCDQCPKSFQWKSNLIRHQVIHSDGSHYLCENCDKYFTDPSNLQRHIRSQHIGARAHTCQDCGKTFATSSGLKQHQHIHSSVKPFQCEVCLKAYTQFSNLCRHKRMHADCRQQIKCKDCGQAFSTVTSLSKHKRFCEGALRNGMRMCYSGDKLSPISIPSVNQTSPLQPSYMGLYGARPPFPFYPGLGASFPIFPPGHPLTAAMSTHMSPNMKFGHLLSPDSKPLMSNMFGNSLFPHVKDEGTENRKMENRSTERSDGSDLTDVSTGSDLDVSSVSDAESEVSIDRKIPRCSTPTPAPPSPKSPDSSDEVLRDFPRMRKSLSPSHRPLVERSPHKTTSAAITITPPQEQITPFDLSKGTTDASPVAQRMQTSGDQPLDLSKKAAIILPVEIPRKTHIFGEMKSPAMDGKQLHYAYPMPSPIMMDTMYRMDKEKIQSFHDAAKLMAYTRYPLTSPTYAAMGSLGMMQHDIEKSMSPIVKMEKSPNQYRYSPGSNKMKERYACKFCGKIFPRSANLTRHLRTHTGEQPYKCKYCERSFSISSNLQRHVRNIHNKEKPFKCDQCDRCFGQQTNLDRHLKKHDTEGPNITDSPINELEDKEESYFSEIRNFIDGESKPMLLNRNAENDPRKVDPKSEAMSPEEDIDMSDDDDVSEDNDGFVSEPLLKKQRLAEPLLMNNNEAESRKSLPYLNGYLPSADKVTLLNNGYTPLACST